jgi:ABC-type amino acid transport substrate-binding protein
VSARRALAALLGGVGLVAVVVTTAIVSAVTLVAFGVPEGRAEDTPPAVPAETQPEPEAAPPRTELVVGLAPGTPGLQAGVVRGSEVLLARGLEVELARAIAERLGYARVRFVAVGSPARLLTATSGSWQVAVAGVEPVRSTVARIGYSIPYLTTDQVLLLRRGTARPRTLAELRTRILCAVRRSAGATAARGVRPTTPVLVAPGAERLMQLVQTGACDAALVSPVEARGLLEGRKALVGPIAARVRHGGGYVVVVRRGSGIESRAIDLVVARLRANGTLGRLSRFWLGFDPASLPVVR